MYLPAYLHMYLLRRGRLLHLYARSWLSVTPGSSRDMDGMDGSSATGRPSRYVPPTHVQVGIRTLPTRAGITSGRVSRLPQWGASYLARRLLCLGR